MLQFGSSIEYHLKGLSACLPQRYLLLLQRRSTSRLILVGLLKSLQRRPLQFYIAIVVTTLEYFILLMLRLGRATIVMLIQARMSDGFDVMLKLLLFLLIFDC